MSQKTAFLVFCFLLASSLSVMAEVRITIASLKWEPYIGPDLKNEGYVGELIRNAFIIRGYNPEIVYLPWARAVMMTKTGCFDAYGPEYFCEDLKKEKSGDIEFMNPPLEKNKNLYLCVSRKNPAASKIIDDFNEGIRLVLEKESFEEMMKKNGIICKSEGQ